MSDGASQRSCGGRRGILKVQEPLGDAVALRGRNPLGTRSPLRQEPLGDAQPIAAGIPWGRAAYRFKSSRIYFPHCSAIAAAIWGNVRERYSPREQWTKDFGFGKMIWGMSGGRFRSQ